MRTNDATLDELKALMSDYNEGDKITIDVNALADLVSDVDDAKEDEFLKQIILMDSDGNPSHIISVRGTEAGLDHLEITTQSEEEVEFGIATQHRLFSSEVEAAEDDDEEPETQALAAE
jgi:hypothetical protein